MTLSRLSALLRLQITQQRVSGAAEAFCQKTGALDMRGIQGAGGGEASGRTLEWLCAISLNFSSPSGQHYSAWKVR